MLSCIVAVASNGVIGKDNKLLWRIVDDLKRFKELTSGHTIIMGRKTFESLGRVLPNRFHVVLTMDFSYKVNDDNVKVVNSLDDIEEYVNDDNENFVIGGSQIYNHLLPKCNKIYLTRIDKEFDGDVYFPDIDLNEWRVTDCQDGPEGDNEFKYKYITYERI